MNNKFMNPRSLLPFTVVIYGMTQFPCFGAEDDVVTQERIDGIAEPPANFFRCHVSRCRLSTDLVSVEATTEWLPAIALVFSKLSTDPVSVEAATGQLLNESVCLFARRFSLKVAAPTDSESMASDSSHLSSPGVAGLSLLPPTQGRWRAFSENFICDCLVISPQKYRSWRCRLTPCHTLTLL